MPWLLRKAALGSPVSQWWEEFLENCFYPGWGLILNTLTYPYLRCYELRSHAGRPLSGNMWCRVPFSVPRPSLAPCHQQHLTKTAWGRRRRFGSKSEEIQSILVGKGLWQVEREAAGLHLGGSGVRKKGKLECDWFFPFPPFFSLGL